MRAQGTHPPGAWHSLAGFRPVPCFCHPLPASPLLSSCTKLMQSGRTIASPDGSMTKFPPRQALLSPPAVGVPVAPTPFSGRGTPRKTRSRPRGATFPAFPLLFRLPFHQAKLPAHAKVFSKFSKLQTLLSLLSHLLLLLLQPEQTLQAAASLRRPPLAPAHPKAAGSERSQPRTHLQSLPRVLLSSALCRCGYWSASFLRAAWAHTMKAFMGLFTWGLFLLDPFTRTGMGTRVQS